MSLVSDEDRVAAHVHAAALWLCIWGSDEHTAACKSLAQFGADARERENRACEDVLHSYAAMGDEIGWIEAINHARLAIADRRAK